MLSASFISTCGFLSTDERPLPSTSKSRKPSTKWQKLTYHPQSRSSRSSRRGPGILFQIAPSSGTRLTQLHFLSVPDTPTGTSQTFPDAPFYAHTANPAASEALAETRDSSLVGRPVISYWNDGSPRSARRLYYRFSGAYEVKLSLEQQDNPFRNAMRRSRVACMKRFIRNHRGRYHVKTR